MDASASDVACATVPPLPLPPNHPRAAFWEIISTEMATTAARGERAARPAPLGARGGAGRGNHREHPPSLDASTVIPHVKPETAPTPAPAQAQPATHSASHRSEAARQRATPANAVRQAGTTEHDHNLKQLNTLPQKNVHPLPMHAKAHPSVTGRA